MKKVVLPLFIISGMSFVLIGCAALHPWNKKNEINTAYKTQPTNEQALRVPAQMKTTSLQNSYAIPPISKINSSQSVSLVPPGSSLPGNSNQTINTPAQPSAVNSPVVSINQTPTPVVEVSPITNAGLFVSHPYSQTWAATGEALNKGGYQIVEKDESLGTYYIADKVSTGGIMKRDTPIYQVHLEQNANGTQITLLNSKNQSADTSVMQRILGSLRNQLH